MFGRSRKGRKGATGMEFGIMVGLVAVVAVAATATVGGKVREIFGGTGNAVDLSMNGMLPPGGSLNLASGVATSAPPVINTTSLTAAAQGGSYSMQLSATATPAGDPIAWSVSGGALPAGLTMSSGGAITGIPTVSGTFPVTVTAMDTVAAMSAAQAYSLSVGAAPTITTTSIAQCYQSSACSATLAGTSSPAGDGVTWSVTSGTLPSGLSVSGAGALSGTTASYGTFPFTVTATDNVTGAKASQALSLVVAQPTVLTCSGSAVTQDNVARKCTFGFSGANQTISVTQGAPTFTIKAWGAGGGGGGTGGTATGTGIALSHGGGGGQLVATYAMGGTGSLTVKIGGGGQGSMSESGFTPAQGGWNGGGTGGSDGGSPHASSGAGGGSTEIWNGATRLLAVGAGGGGGSQGGTGSGSQPDEGGGAGNAGTTYASSTTGSGAAGNQVTYAGQNSSNVTSYWNAGGGGGGWLGGGAGSPNASGGQGGGGGTSGVVAGNGVTLVESNYPSSSSLMTVPMGSAGSDYANSAGQGGRGCSYSCSSSTNAAAMMGNPGYMVVYWQ